MFILVKVLHNQNIVLHLPTNQSQNIYLLTKSNTMTTLTNIEVLRLKRQAAVIKMNNTLKCVTLREEFKIAGKELIAIDEQIKKCNTRG